MTSGAAGEKKSDKQYMEELKRLRMNDLKEFCKICNLPSNGDKTMLMRTLVNCKCEKCHYSVQEIRKLLIEPHVIDMDASKSWVETNRFDYLLEIFTQFRNQGRLKQFWVIEQELSAAVLKLIVCSKAEWDALKQQAHFLEILCFIEKAIQKNGFDSGLFRHSDPKFLVVCKSCFLPVLEHSDFILGLGNADVVEVLRRIYVLIKSFFQKVKDCLPSDIVTVHAPWLCSFHGLMVKHLDQQAYALQISDIIPSSMFKDPNLNVAKKRKLSTTSKDVESSSSDSSTSSSSDVSDDSSFTDTDDSYSDDDESDSDSDSADNSDAES